MVSDINIYIYLRTRVFQAVYATGMARTVDIGLIRAVSSEDLPGFDCSIAIAALPYETQPERRTV